MMISHSHEQLMREGLRGFERERKGGIIWSLHSSHISLSEKLALINQSYDLEVMMFDWDLIWHKNSILQSIMYFI